MILAWGVCATIATFIARYIVISLFSQLFFIIILNNYYNNNNSIILLLDI